MRFDRTFWLGFRSAMRAWFWERLALLLFWWGSATLLMWAWPGAFEWSPWVRAFVRTVPGQGFLFAVVFAFSQWFAHVPPPRNPK